ncbi:precorrin-6y C5,15-methyltransferase (decarboxylating) subunit CbiE [Actinomadura darangshiensis]|uniref:Precorrin-6y C5,15-methyltransferase (Decarboxylating) subunit CbiE n=1 Tax=Actinomadura darangshiensis TaxID=705336 RepID=A0A4R5BDB4_9ACTN|nr:precorrin-6y C5,15-methyltransferase (decarboxylating) subunit CbiE [Actinomadura darangshiensis]TDD81552.1 precorrin-6y C5,15-methyltransferase (decarboxylating) subunit CbiE [Actinomadura darangshiensis]
MDTSVITVVGIGADGWDGLSEDAREALRAADVLFGNDRQLGLVPVEEPERVAWPSPLLPALPGLIERYADRRIAVLASGDPMFHGIGSTLAGMLGPDRLRVLPHPSSASLACARLGWPLDRVDVVSIVGRPAAALNAVIAPGRRILVLGAGREAPIIVAAVLSGRGFGPSRMTALGDLGSVEETTQHGVAEEWTEPAASPLTLTAVECVPGPDAAPLPRTAGLPDDAFEHDGQITRSEVRAVTLSRLAPLPGELLWDVGAGSGSIAIEWARAHPACEAIAIESNTKRAERIAANAVALGVPRVQVVEGEAPDALKGLAEPDAVFIGGGFTVPGLLERCWDALKPGGRLVANAVTLESEAKAAEYRRSHGGELIRVGIERAGPLGGFTAWRPALAVTLWTVRKDPE